MKNDRKNYCNTRYQTEKKCEKTTPQNSRRLDLQITWQWSSVNLANKRERAPENKYNSMMTLLGLLLRNHSCDSFVAAPCRVIFSSVTHNPGQKGWDSEQALPSPHLQC